MGAHPATESGSLTCTHGGVRVLTGAGVDKLTVGHTKVVLLSAVEGAGTYTLCAFQNGTGPCSTTTLPTDPAPSKLTVGAKPVLLDSSAIKAGTPAPAASATVSAGQTTLTVS